MCGNFLAAAASVSRQVTFKLSLIESSSALWLSLPCCWRAPACRRFHTKTIRSSLLTMGGGCLPASCPPCQLPMAGHVGCKVLVPQQSPALGQRGKSRWDTPRRCGPTRAIWQGKIKWWCPTCSRYHRGKTTRGRLLSFSHTISDTSRWAQAKPAVGNIPDLQAGLFGECGLQSRCGAHSWHTSLELAKPKPQICIIPHHSQGLQNSTRALQPETSALELL